MKITRRFHSCVEISDGTTTFVIDPGSFEVPENLSEMDAILITHVHPDHVHAESVEKAGVPIYGPAELANLIDVDYTVVNDGDSITLGDITVEVTENPHATIINSKDLPENLGFLIDGRVLHPGDSYPDLTGLDVCLVPVSAPWMRMLDVDEYLAANKPAKFIGIHDGIDNQFGRTIRSGLLADLANDHGLEYIGLEPGESFEV